ncbi:MAG: hypothetical protein WBD24_04090 [Candidatus Omnitrophota bacterium]
MNNKGVTFTELLWVSAILVIVMAALVVSLVGLQSIFQAIKETAMIETGVRVAGRMIAWELKETSRGRITITQNTPLAGTDEIEYYLPVMVDTNTDGKPDTPSVVGGSIQWDATPVTIALEPGDMGRLLRTEGAAQIVLANNVRRIKFLSNDLDPDLFPDELKIILELEKTGFTGRTYNTVATFFVDMRNSE